MSAKDRAAKAQALIDEVKRIAPIGYSNYQQELQEYRRILYDILILIRDDALAEDAALTSDAHISLER